MKYSELLGKSTDELKESLIDLKKQAFNLRFQKTSGELENTAQIRGVRKDIARVQTAFNSSKSEAAPAAKKSKNTKKKAA